MDKDSGFGTISACGACKDWNDCHDCTSYSESRAEHKEIQDCYSDGAGSGGFWRILLMDKEDGSVGKYDWKIQIKPYTCMA